jgi:hypothetical protein
MVMIGRFLKKLTRTHWKQGVKLREQSVSQIDDYCNYFLKDTFEIDWSTSGDWRDGRQRIFLNRSQQRKQRRCEDAEICAACKEMQHLYCE